MHVFDLYRRLLMIACTVYAGVRLILALASWRQRLSGQGKRKKVMRGYVATMILAIRIRRFAGPIAQIAILLAVLGGVLYLHRYVM